MIVSLVLRDWVSTWEMPLSVLESLHVTSTCSCCWLLCKVLCVWDVLWPADESEAVEGCLAFFHREHLRALQPEPEAEQVSILAQFACAPLYNTE